MLITARSGQVTSSLFTRWLLGGFNLPNCHSIWQNFHTFPKWNYLSDPENKGSRQAGINFDTLGSWNSRLELPLLYEESVERGKVIPKIPVNEIGSATLLGRRKVNEDRYVVEELSPNLIYFGMFDGHSGTEVVDFVSQRMKKTITFWLTQTDNLEHALEHSFIDINNLLARHINFTGKCYI